MSYVYGGGSWWREISLENRVVASRIMTLSSLIEIISGIQVTKNISQNISLKNDLLFHTLVSPLSNIV